MNVLAIGNSFSEDATRYLYGIARADGVRINVVNLYIGGCTLERHYRNMLSGAREYELQYNGHKTGFRISLDEALYNTQWDIITLQQASAHSTKQESYTPYLAELAEHVRRAQPKAKLYIHETWAYEAGSDKLLNLMKYNEPSGMLRDIKTAYEAAAESIGAFGIIRCGELFGKLSEGGIEKVHRDTFHASLGAGRYALALMWYRTLTGRCVTDNAFCDFDTVVTEEEMRIIKAAVESFFAE